MKKTLALLLALVMVLSVASFASAEDGKVISMFLGGGTPLSMDPALNSASAGSNIIRSAFAGLTGFQYNEAGEPEMAPELAESWNISADGLTYTFVLREGLKWSDGTDATASQIKASWERAASPELGADYGFLYDVISRTADGGLDIDVDDAARTFVVHLPQPCAYFLDLCAFVPFYPVRVDLADNEGIWATNPETYIGLGAFKMTKYAVDDVISFEKNPYYWNADAVKLAGLNFYLSEDNTAILTAYENDTVQYIQSISSSEFERLNATYPGELVFWPTQGTYYILFNVHKDLSPSAKQLTVQEQSKARFALGQLINRYEVVTYVTKGGEVAATGFFPTGLADGLNSDVRAAEGYGVWYTGTNEFSDVNPDYTVDQVEALQTLIDLGYPCTGSIEGGDIYFTDFPSIEFAFNNSGNNALIIQYVQETWNQFGISGVVNQEAWATLQSKLKAGDAEAARMGWIADFNDVVNFLEIFISASGNNYPRLGRVIGDYTRNSAVTADAGLGAYWGPDGDKTWAEAYDALVDAVKAATDPVERAKLAAEAEKVLMATGGVNPLYYYTTAQMLKPAVHDVIRLATGDVIWTYADMD
ncbi:MAG: peptide ABC transporter substrate-binding protein [Clostridia bacterium]|nr:peptide ABC transporter substrate-binding protein [Clostridia bacterium]MBR0227100.1 peptide ABC transporter substrate-binding protein [Clostridia bacterium]